MLHAEAQELHKGGNRRDKYIHPTLKIKRARKRARKRAHKIQGAKNSVAEQLGLLVHNISN
jgi:hypothetical protein